MLKAFLHRQAALCLTLSIGIGLSITAALLISQWERENRQLRFQRQTENLATALQRSLNRYTDLLAFLGDYYSAQQAPVERQTFASLVSRSLQTYSGIQALEWAPLLGQADRARYEQRIRAEGYPTFKITELGADGSLGRAAQRSYYVPVTYVEPFTGNESALGFDLYSDTARAAAIAQARDTGSVTATARIRLVQEQRDQFGFLVFQPIYQRLTPASLELRRQQFTGAVLGVFRLSDVVEESLQGLQYEIGFTLYDRSASPTEQFLGRYDPSRRQVLTNQDDLNWVQSECPQPENCTENLIVGQRQWAVRFSPPANYSAGIFSGAMTTLLTGLLLTGGLVLFLDSLSRKLAQTQTLNDLRFRFFSMASHELRTPLSTILLSSESLKINHEQLTEAQKHANIQRIHTTAQRMSQQIADLLMLTRAEVGKLDFNPELLELEQFCCQIVEEFQPSAGQLIQIISPDFPIKAFLDKSLLRSLLTNLLSNAAKYSPPDTSIQLRLESNLQMAIIQITDRGIGIPIAEQPRILDAFYRGSNVGEVAGTGLGLAVAKTCVELHRGEWTIESQLGQGTTVTVKLPLE